MNNKDADQTARMRRLICTFVVCIWLNCFSHDADQPVFFLFCFFSSSSSSSVFLYGDLYNEFIIKRPD